MKGNKYFATGEEGMDIADIKTAAEAIQALQTIDGAGDLQKVKEELEKLVTFAGIDGLGDLQKTKEELELISADTALMQVDVNAIEPDVENIRIYSNGCYTSLQIMDDWDDGADHCETKEYFGGGFYENQVTTGVNDNVFEESSLKLRHCVIHNNHATVTSFIGDSVAQRFPIAPGKEVTLEWVDLTNISHIRSGGANGTLVVVGSTV